MTPERWQQVKGALADALDRDDTRERASFLNRVCAGDPDLGREVRSLLEQPPDEFDSCAETIGLVDPEAPASAAAGRRLGAYELVRELGRGGMGAVWLARRADQHFEKLVAIKLLKRGTDTDEVLSRFHAERRILARLDHPNIARLLDAGTTEEGLPFFVMEYVDGQSLTAFVRESNLSLGERLRLFLKICHAVQFAHQNLVIHRDLKPGNILVTPDGEPKLLDFGVAKLLAIGNEDWQLTLAGQERFTPAYASPEQVRGEAITTVSDVYALGALLYEILAGTPPHRVPESTPTAAQIERIVCEEEPARPSAAVTDPEIRRQLRGDLDTIVLRALAKIPERRYRGAGHLADDLRRYLENRPVRARPDTFGYRAGKFLLRNKTGAAAAALVMIALLVGAASTFWEAQRANRRFQDVRQLANSFLFEFHDAIANVPGTTKARRLIVTRALEYLDSLSREAAGDRQLQHELAEAYLKVGDVQGKPYAPNLGDSDGALRSYTRAAEIAAPLAQREVGSTHTGARRQLIRAYESLAAVESRRNQTADAVRELSQALALGEQSLVDAPEHAEQWRRNIATNHLGLGDATQASNQLRADITQYRAALAHYRSALPLTEQLLASHPEELANVRLLARNCARIAGMLGEIARLTGDADRFREAFTFHERLHELNERALAMEPGNSQLQRNLADGLALAAYDRVLAGDDLDRAGKESAQAIEIEQPLAAADSFNAEAQQDLSFACYVSGRVAQARGQRDAAAACYRRAIHILEPLLASHPDNVEASADLDRARHGLATTAGSPDLTPP